MVGDLDESDMVSMNLTPASMRLPFYLVHLGQELRRPHARFMKV